MLSSTRSKRLFILASVKFLSRASTALNFDPSMATLAARNRSSLIDCVVRYSEAPDRDASEAAQRFPDG